MLTAKRKGQARQAVLVAIAALKLGSQLLHLPRGGGGSDGKAGGMGWEGAQAWDGWSQAA